MITLSLIIVFNPLRAAWVYIPFFLNTFGSRANFEMRFDQFLEPFNPHTPGAHAHGHIFSGYPLATSRTNVVRNKLTFLNEKGIIISTSV